MKLEMSDIMHALGELRQGKYKSKKLPKNKWERELEKIYREDCVSWNHVIDLCQEEIMKLGAKEQANPYPKL